MNILVISPHPDDEVLGMGGTIKKLSKKIELFYVLFLKGLLLNIRTKK